MNKFIGQILNPASVFKRKSLSQKDSDLKPKQQPQNDCKDELQQFEARMDPSHADDDQEFQIQQITEELIFDHQSNLKKVNQFMHLNLKNTQSLPSEHYHQKDPEDSNTPFQQDEGVIFTNLLYNQKSGNPHYQGQYKFHQRDRQSQQTNLQQILSPHMQLQKRSKKLNLKTAQSLVNEINSARQAHRLFLSQFIMQKADYETFLNKSMQKIQQRIRQTVQPLVKSSNKQSMLTNGLDKQKISPSTSILSMQRKWQIQKKLIKEELEQRYHYRIQKLEQELQQQRKYSQQQLIYLNQRKSSFHQSNEIQLIQQLQSTKRQLQESLMSVNQLQIQNEKLNQHIFDVEQQIEGIQLEVQTRVRERIKQYQCQNQKQKQKNPFLNPILQASANLEQSSKLFGMQSLNLRGQKLEQLQIENQHLKKIIDQLQQQSAERQTQITEHEKIIKFRQEQIKQNQDGITYQWAELQKERQNVLIRQQELTTAEDNISRTILQIRTKQSQLQNWQAQLQKRGLSLDFREQEIRKKLEEYVERQNQHNTQKQKMHKMQKQQFKLERQNLGRLKKQNLHKMQRQANPLNEKNRNPSKKTIKELNTDGQDIFRPERVQIPDLPIGKRNDQEYDYKPDRSFQNEYKFKNKQISRQNFEKSFQDVDRSYNRIKQRQKMSVTTSNFRQARGSHNMHPFVLPLTSKGPLHHSRSKSKSKEKNLLRNFNSNAAFKGGFKTGKYMEQVYQNKPNSNLDGLGSKLQRLRDQIKREIDSIK